MAIAIENEVLGEAEGTVSNEDNLALVNTGTEDTSGNTVGSEEETAEGNGNVTDEVGDAGAETAEVNTDEVGDAGAETAEANADEVGDAGAETAEVGNEEEVA